MLAPHTIHEDKSPSERLEMAIKDFMENGKHNKTKLAEEYGVGRELLRR
jgi:hypothetical protein